MAHQIQAGTMMVQQSATLQSLEVDSEPYCRNWRSLGVTESLGLDRKVRAAGGNLFFMASEIRAVVPAWGGQNTLRRGVKRLLAQTRMQHFNCLEVSHILKKHFFGIPYVSIAAHSRHIQSIGKSKSGARRERGILRGSSGIVGRKKLIRSSCGGKTGSRSARGG